MFLRVVCPALNASPPGRGRRGSIGIRVILAPRNRPHGGGKPPADFSKCVAASSPKSRKKKKTEQSKEEKIDSKRCTETGREQKGTVTIAFATATTATANREQNGT